MAAKKPTPKQEETLLTQLQNGTADTSSEEFQKAMAQVIEHLNGNIHFEPKIN